MSSNERLNIFYKHRNLIDEYLERYSPDKPDYENLYDSGIRGLFKAIDEMHGEGIDFKSYAIFCIKSEINDYIQDNK